MPKTKDPRYEQFVKEFKAGLVGAESGGDYSAVNQSAVKKNGANRSMVARGKYQMVPKYHWEDIKNTARKNKRPVPATYDDYLKDTVLQELHFDWYTENRVWPTVNKDSTKAVKAGLSLGAYGYYNHFDPSAAKKFIATGEHRKATDLNPSGKKVIANFEMFRNKSGVQPYYGYTESDYEREYNNYTSQIKNLDSNENYSEEIKAQMKQELYNKYRNQGYIQPNNPDGTPNGFNMIIDKKNKKKQKEFKEAKASLTEDLEVLNKTKLLYVTKNGKVKIQSASNTPFSKDDAKQLEKVVAKNPKFFKKGMNAYHEVDLNYIKNVEKKYETLTGKKLNLLNPDNTKGKDLDLDVSKFSVLGKKFGDMLGESSSYSANPILSKDFEVNDNLSKINYIDYIAPTEDEEQVEEQVEETPVENNTPPLDTADATSVEIESAKRMSMEKKEVPTTLASDDFFREKDEVPEGVDSQDFKDEFPWAQVLGNAAGAFAGLSMADKRIPMRDEQVSGAFRNYAAELKKLSEIGLRPEEEAYAKRMITESYSGSIDQLVKASGGARNLVLGNLGRIDAQKGKSLMELAVADASAKTDALHKYGEAAQYINEFDARRDIANNERKYKDVLMTKEAGAQLAQASFSGMMDSLNEYRDNKPGSVNHAYKSMMYRKIYGYDPQLKDDRTGNTKYTFSWMKKQNENIAKAAIKHNEIRDMYWQMNPDEKKQMNEFMLSNNFEGYEDFAKQIFSKRNDVNDSNIVTNEKGEIESDGIVLSPEQLADDSSGYDDPNYIGPDGKKAIKSTYSSILNEADNNVSANKDGIITSNKSYLNNPNLDQDMLAKYPPDKAYQESLKMYKQGKSNSDEFPSEDEFTQDYIKQFEMAVDSKIKPAETKAIEVTNPLIETPAQKLERLNKETELYLKNDVSGKQIDDMIFKQQKETEEMIKNMQKY